MYAVMCDKCTVFNDRLVNERNLCAVFDDLTKAVNYIREITYSEDEDCFNEYRVIKDEMTDEGRKVTMRVTPKRPTCIGVHEQVDLYHIQGVALNP